MRIKNSPTIYRAGILIAIMFLSLFLFIAGHVQAAGVTYYSQGNLPPHLTSSWNTNQGGGGSNPTNFTGGDIFVIQNGHNMSTSATWSISGSSSKLQIENGGTLTANNAITLASTTTFQIDSGGTYIHNNSSAYGSTIFQGSESFASNSNVILQNSNSTGPSGVTFGNLTIDFTTDPGGSVNCSGGLTTINGNLTISNTSIREFRLTGNTDFSLTIGGNLTITGGTLNVVNGNGDYTISVSGDVSLSGGTLNLGGGSGASKTYVLNLGGGVSQTGGTFQSTNANSPVTINFTGGTSTVTFATSGGTFSNTNMNWQIASGKTVELNTNFGSGGWVASTRTMTVNGSMQINSSAYPGDIGTWSYNTSTGTLIFNTSGSYTVGSSHPYWLSGNSPAHVVITSGTINLPNTSRTVLHDLTINGGTLALNGTSGDLNVGGNWTRAAGATFTPNGRAVFFNGTGTQTVAVTGGGTETFNYLVVDKVIGNLTLSSSPATNVTVNATSGDALQIINAGGIDLNGQTLTMSGSGGNFLVGGATTGTRTVTGSGTFSVTGSKTVTNNNSRTLLFDSNVTVALSSGLNFGSSLSTVNGTLRIDSGGFVSTNPPTYGTSSLLQYNSGGAYGANTEWTIGATSGAGVPQNVQVSASGTNVTLSGVGTHRARGNVTIDANTTLTLAGTDNLELLENWTNNGTLTAGSGRVVSFIGSTAQVIGGSGTTTFNGLTVNNSSGVSLGVGARVEGVLTLTSGWITLNTYNLTLGPSATTSGTFSAGNMIVADSTGQLRKEFSGTGSFTFPVGDATSTAEYSPATVNFGSGTFGGGAYVGLTLSDAKHGNNGSADHITRYWTLTQSGISSFSADVSFSYLDADIVGTEANLYGAKYDGSTWTILNAANTGANTVGGTVSSFSDFTAGNSTLPVTLAYFQATRRGDSTYFNWQTATETGNVGFNLYVEGKDGLQLVNPQLIASAAVDSLEPQPYTFTANGLSGDVFYIEDVDLFGRRLLHGPFGLGNSYGEWVTVEAIDWAAIQAEQEALTAVRLPAGQPPANQVDLLVSQDGIYRLTYEQLLAFGLDLAGKRTNQLRLTNKGVSVPVYVLGPGATFGPGGYIEFYGQAVDSVYTHTNLYNLSVGGNVRVKVDNKAIPNQPPAGYYLATVTVENNLAYSQTAPNGDPWYRNTLLAYTSPVVGNYAIQINNYVAGATASLTVDVWGNTDWPEYSPDHHLQVSLNGTQVADGLFNGIVSYPVNVTIPAGVLQEGNNTVTLRLPGDSGAPFDMIALDSYSVTYPRSFVAENGKLQFSAAASVFAVQNLPSPNVVVYRLNGAGLARMQTVQVVPAGNGTYTASFRGLNSIATYFVYAVESLPTPTLQTPRPFTDIKTGSAQYLVIAHPNFIAGIQPLVAKHQSDGLTTKVVDLFDIYAQYGYGMVYPQAIQDYIAYAAANMGTQYVLLVGGDTYDYFNYTGSGSISFVPTLYAATDALVKYAPVDSLYADVDDDGVPDLAIGRFPVRTVAELDLLVNKTLVYAAKDYGNTAVFAADATSGIMSYGNESDGLISLLPAGWTTTSAYIDSLGVTAARQTLLDSLNSGVALTNYFGHSGPTMWTFLGLFNTTYAANLTNSGRPTVVNQWGCWNTYHVTPAYNTLAHVFMLSGDRGAAAVLGSATLTQSSSDKALGQLMTPLLAQPGVTIGEAIWQAKQQLALQNGTFTDVILGFTLLGDPALLITP